MVGDVTMLQGLVLGAMAAYAVAAVALVLRARRPGMGAFAVGFVLAAAAVIERCVEVGHAPMQNLFEVFLMMAALVFPIALLCRRLLGVGAEAADAVIGLALLTPVAFVFDPQPRMLPPALQSPLFIPHVAAYLAAYVVLAKAAVQAFLGLLAPAPVHDVHPGPYERSTYRMVGLGFPLLTLGLVLGSVWGKLAWGDYWNWDPKELWSLAAWLVFLAYLHVRPLAGPRRPRLGLVLVLVGAAAIVVTLLWVNLAGLFSGLHSYA